METPDNASEVTTQTEGDRAGEPETKTTESPEKETPPAPEVEVASAPPVELPTEVRAKLRRLDKLEPRYHGMA